MDALTETLGHLRDIFGGPKRGIEDYAEEAIEGAIKAEAALDGLIHARNLLRDTMSSVGGLQQSDGRDNLLTTLSATIDQLDRGILALGRKP